MRKLLFGAVIAAAGRWFLHPERGDERRSQARDRAMQFGRQAKDGASGPVGDLTGKLRQKGSDHGSDPYEVSGGPNDPALQAKVESEIFRDANAPKGQVSVNAEGGVVYLRGQLNSREQIQELAEAAGRVEGVRGVENLLHTPDEPAPMKVQSHHASSASA